jgi:hypothetical protein
MTWGECWDAVRLIVTTSRRRSDALARVSALRRERTTWAALSRAWRRQVRVGAEKTGTAGEALGTATGGVITEVGPGLFLEQGTSDEQPHTRPTTAVDLLNGLEPQQREWVERIRQTRQRVWGDEPSSQPSGQKHLVIPDTQTEWGVPLDHFKWIGRYIVAKNPDTVIHLGDHWDFPSLSSYDSPTKKAATGQCKRRDIDAGNKALEMIDEELVKGGWKGRKVLLEGNHDGFSAGGRPARYLDNHPDDRGILSQDMLADSWLGWERVPFLKPIEIDGVLYCHLFPLNRDGTATAHAMRQGAANAKVQVAAVGQSCTAGHKQGLDTHILCPPYSRTRRGVVAGSCYLHEAEYLGPAKYWRGVLVKHAVGPDNPNHYDLMEVSLDFLKRRHG